MNLGTVSGTLHTEGQDSPKSFLSFAVPKFTNAYEVGNIQCYHSSSPMATR